MKKFISVTTDHPLVAELVYLIFTGPAVLDWKCITLKCIKAIPCLNSVLTYAKNLKCSMHCFLFILGPKSFKKYFPKNSFKSI